MKDYLLPPDHRPYTDKYFLRANEVLKAEDLNPIVRAQVFIRKGPGHIYGIDEAIAMLDKYTGLNEHGGRILALPEGAKYSPTETLMLIEGPVQDIIELETMYLGVISAETTLGNDGRTIDLEHIAQSAEKISKLAPDRALSYFGARHWRYDRDEEIAKAAFKGGFAACSTDIGAIIKGQKGTGTIPHALENIFAWKYGIDDAVKEATLAFDRRIDAQVPRIALIDYANREITDTISVAKALGERLYGVRVDTPGENIAEGGKEKVEGDRPYWTGTGVTLHGVHALKKALIENGMGAVKIILSSGFGDMEKVRAFTEAEKELGIRLFDGLGIGGLYYSRMATMDIVGVGHDYEHILPLSKVGRGYKPNQRLELVRGE